MPRAFGPLTATTPTGEPLSSATVAYKEPDGATTLAAALYAASSGGSTTTHQTNSKGQLNRYADYAQRAYYTLNGDTTLWPIDFEVDPADVCAMGADGVTVTKGYRAVARMRVAALEGKVRDMGGFVANVDAFADGVTVNNAQAASLEGTPTGTTIVGGDCTAAVTAALAYLNSVGGGILEFGIGTYFYPTITAWGNNIQVRGTRGQTVLMHRPGNSSTIVNALNGTTGYTNFGFVGITFNGNYENNIDFDAGSSEVAFRGTDTYLYDCTVKNFNAFGVQFGGTRPVIANCRILGPNDGAGVPYGSYADITEAAAGGATPNRYGGRDGLFTPVATTGALVYGNYVSGLRLPGMFIGGDGLICGANHIENCHRSYGLGLDNDADPATPLPHVGGGQIGICPNVGTGPGNASQDFVLFDNYIGPTTVGTYASGIELDSCYDGVLDGNTVVGVPGFGITLASTQRIAIMGGSIRGCGTYGLRVNGNDFGSGLNTSKFTVIGVSFKSNATAVHMNGATNHYAVIGCMFEGNTTNWDNTATGTNRTMWGNVTIDGDVVPDISSKASAGAFAGQFVNTSATGYGLYVQAGADGTQYAARFRPYDNSRVILDLYASGESLQRTAITTGVARLDITQGSAGTYKHLLAQRNSSTIWGLGSNATDDFVVWNAALNLQNLKVSDAGVMTVRGQTILPAGLVGTPSFVFAGTATGLYSSGSSDMDFATAGTHRFSLKTNGDIVPGTAALATNATTGFMYIATCAGTPTGVPAGTYTGRAAMVFDTTNNKWYIYDGGWIGVTLS